MKKVILRISGGLGNQLFQMGYAYSFAQKRKIELEINSYYMNLFFRKGSKFSDKRELVVNKLKLTNKNILYKNLKEKNLINIGFKARIFRIPMFRFVYCKLTGVHILDGYFQNNHDFLSTKQILPELKNNIKKYLSPKPEKMVGLHIRAGDLINQPWNRLCGFMYYKKCIEEIKKIYNFSTIFVVTENPAFARELLRNINVKFCFLEPKPVLSDFINLASYKYLICANSSFSWWAGVLGNAETFFSPEFFYVKNDKPRAQTNEIIINHNGV